MPATLAADAARVGIRPWTFSAALHVVGVLARAFVLAEVGRQHKFESHQLTSARSRPVVAYRAAALADELVDRDAESGQQVEGLLDGHAVAHQLRTVRDTQDQETVTVDPVDPPRTPDQRTRAFTGTHHSTMPGDRREGR